MFLNGQPCEYPPARVPIQLIDKAFQNAIRNLMLKYSSYLEIGSYDGVTISQLATLYPAKQFYSIDTFAEGGRSEEGCLQFFLDNCSKFDNIHLYIGMSQVLLPNWLLEGKMFGLVLVDGDHSFRGAFDDICFSWAMLEPGGTMLLHDYGAKHFGVTEAVNLFTYLTGKQVQRVYGLDVFVK